MASTILLLNTNTQCILNIWSLKSEELGNDVWLIAFYNNTLKQSIFCRFEIILRQNFEFLQEIIMLHGAAGGTDDRGNAKCFTRRM